MHRDKGAITNLLALQRPLSLFGLTANMQGYEPGEIKPLQKQLHQQEEQQYVQVSVLTNSCNARDADYFDELAEFEELCFL